MGWGRGPSGIPGPGRVRAVFILMAFMVQARSGENVGASRRLGPAASVCYVGDRQTPFTASGIRQSDAIALLKSVQPRLRHRDTGIHRSGGWMRGGL